MYIWYIIGIKSKVKLPKFMIHGVAKINQNDDLHVFFDLFSFLRPIQSSQIAIVRAKFLSSLWLQRLY